jgi:hypothetical protein
MHSHHEYTSAVSAEGKQTAARVWKQQTISEAAVGRLGQPGNL